MTTMSGSIAPAQETERPPAAERAGRTVEEAGHRAADAVGGARRRLEERVDRGASEAGARVEHAVAALRRSADSLREDGDAPAANVAQTLAERAERVADYLSGADARRLADDGSRAVRRRPWAFAAGGVAAGLVAARIVRISSDGSANGASAAWGTGDGQR